VSASGKKHLFSSFLLLLFINFSHFLRSELLQNPGFLFCFLLVLFLSLDLKKANLFLPPFFTFEFPEFFADIFPKRFSLDFLS
jgi:hypothetical protein